METAYRHVRAAEIQLLDLYDENELQADIRPVVVRANSVLNREDPRQRTVEEFREDRAAEQLRPRLRGSCATAVRPSTPGRPSSAASATSCCCRPCRSPCW